MRTFPALLLVATAVAAVSCNAATSVDAPDIITTEDYETPAGATALAAGAISLFHTAFGGGGAMNQVVASGLIADELFYTSSTQTDAPIDSRDAQDPSAATVSQPYTNLQIARQRLLDAIGQLHRVAPDSGARIGQLFAMLGYTSIFLGENYCAGVPLSHRDASLRAVYGQPLTTTQLFDSALTAFDSAQFYGIDSARFVNLARIGRGRALLNLGQYAAASAAVTGVPTTYTYDVTFVTGTLQNGLASNSLTNVSVQNRVTIPQSEGTNGINWRTAGGTAPDPRAVVINRSPAVIGLDGSTQVWQASAHQAANAPIRLAGGVEARLIEAEAALQAGNTASWLAIHNALRSTVPGLAALSDPGTAPARVSLHFRERALWLFLTGHRHGDLRRLIRQHGRAVETVFPTGVWRDGISYSTATNLAPPSGQMNNPHYSGCLDRNP